MKQQKCKGKYQNGKPCRNYATQGGHCDQHQNQRRKVSRRLANFLFKGIPTGVVAIGIYLMVFYNNTKTFLGIKNHTSATALVDSIINNEASSEDYRPNSPGFGFAMIVNIKDTRKGLNRFIFDCGKNTDRDRVSLYLDSSSDLVFRIIDRNSKPYLLKIPRKLTTFQENSFFFLHGEYGFEENGSFMRMFINDKETARSNFNYKINVSPRLDIEDIKVGSDILGNSGSEISIGMFTTVKSTLSEEQINALLNAFMKYIESLGYYPSALEVGEEGFLDFK